VHPTTRIPGNGVGFARRSRSASSREDLEKASHGGAGGGSKLRMGGSSKAETLAGAGIPISTANDYEQLTGGWEEQAADVLSWSKNARIYAHIAAQLFVLDLKTG
jgi:hypothetical protein